MSTFSDESRLLVEKWETVQDVLKAVERLKGELTAFLHSIGDTVREAEWWDDTWVFRAHSSEQVYITRTCWVADGKDIVWIGVEKFHPDGVFLSGEPPILYVWVNGRAELVSALIDEFGKLEAGLLGKLDSRSSGYVIKDSAVTCLPEQIDTFLEAAREKIVTFFGFYAEKLMELDDVIQKHIG